MSAACRRKVTLPNFLTQNPPQISQPVVGGLRAECARLQQEAVELAHAKRQACALQAAVSNGAGNAALVRQQLQEEQQQHHHARQQLQEERSVNQRLVAQVAALTARLESVSGSAVAAPSAPPPAPAAPASLLSPVPNLRVVSVNQLHRLAAADIDSDDIMFAM